MLRLKQHLVEQYSNYIEDNQKLRRDKRPRDVKLFLTNTLSWPSIRHQFVDVLW